MFRASSRPSSRAQQLQKQSLVLLLERGGISAVGGGRASWPDHDQQHWYHHAPTIKPEATTVVVKLLMMGVRKSETCWAVHKHQVINVRNVASIWLIYWRCMMMHGLANFKHNALRPSTVCDTKILNFPKKILCKFLYSPQCSGWNLPQGFPVGYLCIIYPTHMLSLS
jgi:hypothetical protein